jgi:hypothetical protein
MTRSLLWPLAVTWGVLSAYLFPVGPHYWVKGAVTAFVGGAVLALLDELLAHPTQ